MHIIPDSSITLYSGVETSRKIVFSSRANQAAYYANHVTLQYAPCTMIRKTGKLRVEVAGTVISTCNYLSFTNPSFDNKVFYARILDYDYINNECCEIQYGIDYFQSFMFDVTFRECYIDREHLSEEDYAKSLVNPYDPSILEFQTDEGLPVGRDLENRLYKSNSGFRDDNIINGESASVCRLISPGITKDYITVISVAKIEPPTDSDATWYTAFKNKCGYNQIAGYETTSNAALGYVNGTDPSPKDNVVWMNKAMYDKFGVSFTTPMQTYPPASLTTTMTHPYDMFFIKDASDTTMLQDFLDKLTSWNCINAIIGIYAIPRQMLAGIFSWNTELLASWSKIWPLPIGVDNSNTQYGANVVNKKLVTFPFAYIRCEAPDGSAKEYRYEDFANVYNPDLPVGNKYTGVPTFILDGNLCGEPTVSLIPAWYKRMNIASVYAEIDELSTDAVNYFERVEFKSFSQMPYNTDGFLTSMSAAAEDIRRSNTHEKQYQISAEGHGNMADFEYLSGELAENSVGKWAKILEIGGSVASTVGSAAGQAGQFVVDVGQSASNAGSLLKNMNARAVMLEQANQWGDNMSAYDIRRNMYKDVNDYSTETLDEDNAIYDNFKDTKRGYAVSNYVAPTGGGLEYYQYAAPFDFIITRVKLRDEILAKYDNYFSAFGYKSDRYGIPRIANFIRGASSDKPTFMQVGSFNVTYIKTFDLNVECPLKPVEDYFRALFNAGAQFINGDLLR